MRFVGRRIAALVPQLLFASLLLFFVLRLLPGDLALSMLADTPHTLEMREALREELGLTEPLPVQYLRWLWDLVSGIQGTARSTGEPLREMVASRLPVTLLLTLYSVIISLLVAIPAGVVAGGSKNRLADGALRFFALCGLALPSVWVALLLILLLLRAFSWSPPIIYFGLLEFPGEHLLLLIWPALLLAWEHAAHLVPVVRAGVRDALAQPFTLAARARGLSRRQVVWRHAARSAVRPAVTAAALQIGSVLGGSLVLETVFGIPGMGRAIVDAALARDFPAVQTLVMVLSSIFLLILLVVDVLLPLLDPRMRGVS